MSSDIKYYNVRINVKQKIKGVKLQIIDGQFKEILNQATCPVLISLPKGLYVVHITLNDYFKEEIIVVDSDAEFNFDIEYSIAAPVGDFKTTHEYYSGPAEQASTKATVRNESRSPNLLLFLAKYGKDATQADLNFGKFTLFAIDENAGSPIEEPDFLVDNNGGSKCFSTHLRKGLYFLKSDTSKGTRIFPVYIFEGYQTQFFIRYTQRPGESTIPDFANARIYISEKMGFKRDAPEYFVLEKILLSYTKFSHFKALAEDENEMNIVRSSPYLTTLVNTLHLALGQKKPLASKELGLPDLKYFQDHNFQISDAPPLMSFVMHRYVMGASVTDEDHSSAGPISRAFEGIKSLAKTKDPTKVLHAIQPASVVDRVIDQSFYDIFWTSFGGIAEPIAWREVYEKFLTQVKNDPENKNKKAGIGKVIRYGYKLFGGAKPKMAAELIDIFVQPGKYNLSVNHDSLFDDIEKIKLMSKQFKLPPTMIMRNFEVYQKEYDLVMRSKKVKDLTFKE